MKTMMICCGAGVATSTVALKEIEKFLDKEGLTDQVRIVQGSVSELSSRNDIDFVVSTSPISNAKVPVISGMSFLTKIPMQVKKTCDQIKEQLA